VAQSNHAAKRRLRGRCGNSEQPCSVSHATTGSLTMYRAHGTRLMAVHANYLARVRVNAHIPRRYKDVPWARLRSCRLVSLIFTYTPTCRPALHPSARRAPRGVGILLHDSTLQHVGETHRREGHWQRHHSNTRDTIRLANRRIPSRREANMATSSLNLTAGYQHDSDGVATCASIEASRWWIWIG